MKRILMAVAAVALFVASCTATHELRFGYVSQTDDGLVPCVVNDPVTNHDEVVYLPRVQALWLERHPAQVIEVLETREIKVGTVWRREWVRHEFEQK